jgi:hypothetical protein
MVMGYNLDFVIAYSYLSNKRGGWNKRGGGAKVANSLNVEGGIFWKKLVHNSNKPGVEGGIFQKFSKSVLKHDFTFIRGMRVS